MAIRRALDDARGSLWHRWDPHIHAPGTVLNDQYPAGSTGRFVQLVETSNPPIRALGITDYYGLGQYTQLLDLKKQGRMPTVDLLFPNVEMRYAIGGKGSPINVHLLVSPEDPNHVAETERLLRNFTFKAHDETYRCDRDDLIRLGRASDKKAQDDAAALRAGTLQFKINFDELREVWKNNRWVQENVLVGVAVGTRDGTAGLQSDAAWTTVRQEIERFAHIIFTSQAAQRDFWLGRGAATKEQLSIKWGGLKPCIHGSDAHSLPRVGKPDGERNCWIKGDLTFESLRQACLDPEQRVLIGPDAPQVGRPSQIISKVRISNAAWAKTPEVALNPGLVAIIGARGSGKTALADFIATGADAIKGHLSERSFVHRARPLVGTATVHLTWAGGDEIERQLSGAGIEDSEESAEPAVQYLSQQFVEALCSSEGITDELLAEIERVIFQAHPMEERMGAQSFQDLLLLRSSRTSASRSRHEEALAEVSQQLVAERERQAKLPALTKQLTEKRAAVAKDKIDRAKLIGGKATEKVAQRLVSVSAATEAARTEVDRQRRQEASLLGLKDAVEDYRVRQSPALVVRMREQYRAAGFDDTAWKAFATDFRGDVTRLINDALKRVKAELMRRAGPASGERAALGDSDPFDNPFLSDDEDLTKPPLSLLEKEVARLRRLVGIDAERARTHKRLSEQIARNEEAIKRLEREVDLAEKAPARIQDLRQARKVEYQAVFQAIIDAETELRAIYAPLQNRLKDQPGTLGQLTFSVRRTIDLKRWTDAGEALLDLRKAGPYKGHGSLLDAAAAKLLRAWETGTAAEAADALSDFVADDGLQKHSQHERSDVDAYRAWVNRVSAWLYSTTHIKVAYGIQYGGVQIEQLSPGTRGIVLLLLYLALDSDDDRPLVIDQPEENLDPKSVFVELVDRFRAAKRRRQVIIVTHNSNLVVNADADQVIVATCGPHRAGRLPPISYESGSLENPVIRREVCEILEGGEAAFLERARRLRLRPQ